MRNVETAFVIKKSHSVHNHPNLHLFKIFPFFKVKKTTIVKSKVLNAMKILWFLIDLPLCHRVFRCNSIAPLLMRKKRFIKSDYSFLNLSNTNASLQFHDEK